MIGDYALSGRPSYDLKMERAEKHLVDVERIVADWVKSNPTTISSGIEGKKKKRLVHRAHVTEPPNDEIAPVLGDFIFNVRSALDHLAYCLSKGSNRNGVYFPIYWQGVWEPAAPGENVERAKDRNRWKSYVSTMQPEAVAIIERQQPHEGGFEDGIHALKALNQLRNTDAHKKLVVSAGAVKNPTIAWTVAGDDENVLVSPLVVDGRSVSLMQHGAPIEFPDDAVEMYFRGTPSILVRCGEGHLPMEEFRPLFLRGIRNVIDQLRPFDRVNRINRG